jgi:hypothetical protein
MSPILEEFVPPGRPLALPFGTQFSVAHRHSRIRRRALGNFQEF